MKKISIIIFLMIGLSLLLLTGCQQVGVTPEIDTSESGTGEADTTKPVIIGSRAPLPNAAGWNNTDVTVSFSCEDVGEVQSGIVTNTVQGATVTTEGKDQSVTNTGECIDAAGNVADPVIVSNINIDKTPPVVTITLSKNGKYKLNESVTGTWSAIDSVSGVKLSKAPKKFTLDTKSKGWKNFTLPPGLVQDEAGNSSEEVTITYEVVNDDSIEPEPVIPDPEEPVIVDPGDPNTVYPQTWATGDGTASNPWANDCIRKAYDACPVGGTIFLEAGYYILSDKIDIRKKVNIIGEGRNKTIIITADAHGLHINGVDYVTIKNMTIDGSAQATDGTYSACIAIGYSDYVVVENVEVKNAGCIGIDTNTCRYMLMQDIYAHDSVYSHGIHSGTDISGYNAHNTYRNIYAWNNGESGFDDRGDDAHPEEDTYNVYDNLHCWDNGTAGVSIFSQHNCIISNSSISGSGNKGLNLWHIEDFNIHDCYIELNDEEGIFLRYSDNNNFTNVIVKNNSVDGAIYYGITVLDSNGTRFTSCQSYDDRNTPLQKYGLKTEGNVDYVSLVNCILLPNLYGAIANPAEAVIIDGIKLASL